MSSASSTTASLLRRRSRSIDYEMTFTDLSWVDDPFSPPTSNASAESQKTSRTSVSLFHNCKKTDTQPHFRGIDALFSRSDNLNRHTVARKTMNQPSSSIQFRKEVHSMQKIGNHDRPDLARTDTLHGIGAVPDTMEKAGHAESDWLFNRDFENLESEESPKSGKQKKLLRLQGLRKSGNSWPAEFLTTRPLDLKAENPPYKQSSLRMTELEEFLKAGNQLYKQRSLATTELGEFLNTDQHYTLDRQLKSHHIHLIALGSTIGTGIFLSPPVHGPLSLLMAFTLIGLIAWPFMYTLGELAAHFPMDIENSWIEDLNLYQKPPQFVILSGAAFSILQIMVSVAGVEFIPDGLLTCLFVISRIAFGVILYSATLKAISWTISRIRLLIQTCIESCTSSLPGRSSRSKSHAGQALIMSFLLWTTPVTAIATSLDTSTLSPCSSFLDVLYLDSGKLFSVSPFPSTQTKPNKPNQLTKTNPALHNPPTTFPPLLPGLNPPPRPPAHHFPHNSPLHPPSI